MSSAAKRQEYSVTEAKALHELGVRNHGWYMTEAEHRGVLRVIERLEREYDALKASYDAVVEAHADV